MTAPLLATAGGVNRLAGPLLVTMLLAANAVSAQQQPSTQPTAVLRYARGPATSQCPDEESLRAAVSARLGYDPFQSDAPMTIAATIVRRGHLLHARVEITDEHGAPIGSRELSSAGRDCTEIAQSMTLAISIA